MNIKIKKSELVSKLGLLMNVIKENRIRPALSQVLIMVDEEIKLIGTDLEQTLICKLDGEILEQGKTTFNIKENFDLIKLTESDIIEIKTNAYMLEIDNMSFTTYDTLEFPEIRIQDSEESEVKTEDLIRDINKSTFAASQKPENIEINCLRIADKTMTTTDSYRMVILGSDIVLKRNVSIPIKSVDNLVKILNSTIDEKTKVSFESNKAVFKTENMTYTTRLIDLPFPDVNAIMKNVHTDKKAVIDSITFQKILKKVLVITKNNVEIKDGAIFTFSPGKLIIQGKSDSSKIKETLRISYSGEDTKVCLNCRFLMDYAKNIKNMLEINFSNKNSAFVLKEEGLDNYKYLTMPLAIKD